MFCCLLSSGLWCSVACYFFSISFRCVGLFHLKDSPLLSWCLWEQPCSATWGLSAGGYLLTSLQVAGQWGPHLYLLTSQPSVPSWLPSPDHAAHSTTLSWLKVFSTQPVGIIHAEIPAQVSSLLVLLWPQHDLSFTHFCIGFLPSLLCFQPAPALTHWEKQNVPSSSPSSPFPPRWHTSPIQTLSCSFLFVTAEERPPLLCRVCLSPPCPPPSGPLCWDPLGFVSHLLSMFPPIHK